jgi:urease accessory protein
MNYVLWQLIDSGFPAGGFAHSNGLEACLQHGHVVPETVRSFALQALAQAGRSALPLVNAAHLSTADFAGLDRLADVFLSNPVANRASRAQGLALITGALRSFRRPGIEGLADRVTRERLSAHHAPVFGAVTSALAIERLEAQRAFLFVAVRGVTSAAVRLGVLGPYDAQQLQARLADSIDEVIDENGERGPYDIAQTAPLVDLFQSTHDRLYSRLFQS